MMHGKVSLVVLVIPVIRCHYLAEEAVPPQDFSHIASTIRDRWRPHKSPQLGATATRTRMQARVYLRDCGPCRRRARRTKALRQSIRIMSAYGYRSIAIIIGDPLVATG